MTVEGHIENGHIVLDAPVNLPDGTKVRVELVHQPPAPGSGAVEPEEELPSLYERMKPIIGKAKGLPADYAINHDHYLHGQPKRQ